MTTDLLPPTKLLQNNTLIHRYFNLTPLQNKSFHALSSLYTTWNQQLNLISRKDIANLYLHHILHSLSIGKIIQFQPKATILDVGTGGGLPGIPLAILFPKTQFMLIDGTAKKIKAVQHIVDNLELNNVNVKQIRAEELKSTYDFIVCRSVASLEKLHTWTKNNLNLHNQHKLPNGVLCLKGGDLTAETNQLKTSYRIYNLSNFFQEPFFATKKLVHLFKNPR